MIATLGIKLEKIKNVFIRTLEKVVECNAIFAMDAAVAGLALKARGLLRWRLDVDVDERWDQGAEGFDKAGGVNMTGASFDDGRKLFEQRQEQALEGG